MNRVAARLAACLATALSAGGASAADRTHLEAARAPSAVHIDGRLDDDAWQRATPFDAFVEIYPHEGGSPRRHTEVRFLHDDTWIFVAVRCDDEAPDDIARPLGRRDRIPSGSDTVAVALDSARDRRSGYLFIVSAGGVMEDRLLFDDTGETEDWDAVWDAAVQVDDRGWSAEIAIPFAALRFSASDETTFGAYVERKVGLTHEVLASSLVPQGAHAFVSRFGDLALGRVDPTPHAVVMPFVASRLVLQPSAGGSGVPRRVDPVGDLGLDATLPLSSAATLTAAVAPDFGQVEADPVVLNLTRYETFFPEKRPFFLRDLDLFQPVGGASGDVPQQLLYTRRIGADAPVLAAAKVTGSPTSGLSFGVIDAFVAGAAAGPGDATLRFHPEQPLHLAPESTLPAVAPPPTNFAAAVVRAGSSRGSSAGLVAVAATPFTRPCTAADAARQLVPQGCAGRGGLSGAATLTLRTSDAAYGLVGQVSASHALGGPPVRTLTDGTQLRPGDDGLGAYFTAGKVGGEPVRAFVGFELSEPRLDLTFAGFQPDSNLLAIRPEVRLVRAAGLGPFHEVQLGVRGALRRTVDGRDLDRGRGVHADAKLVLPGFHEVTCDGGWESAAYDVREIVGSGVAYLRPPFVDAGCGFASDAHRPFAFELSGHVTRTEAAPPLPSATAWRVRAGAAVRVHPRAETRVSAELDAEPIPGRFIAPDEVDAPPPRPGAPGRLLFGDIDARSLSLTLRQLVVLGRRLTLEGYAQLFTDYGTYRTFYGAAPSGGTLAPADLSALDTPPAPRPDFVQASLRVTAVLRWEYRPGSTFFAVYQRSSDAFLPNVIPETARFAPDLLAPRAATDVFLLKLSVALER
jgi:hypothetical protein